MKLLDNVSKETKQLLINWLEEDRSTCLESDNSVGIYPDYDLADAFHQIIDKIKEELD